MNDFFRWKVTGQRTFFFCKTVVTNSWKQRTVCLDMKRKVHIPHVILTAYPSSHLCLTCLQNKICWLIQSCLMVLMILQKELFFKPFDWKKLQPENDPGVWSELHCYTFLKSYWKVWSNNLMKMLLDNEDVAW